MSTESESFLQYVNIVKYLANLGYQVQHHKALNDVTAVLTQLLVRFRESKNRDMELEYRTISRLKMEDRSEVRHMKLLVGN